ncbi:MAG: hypothetical protein KDC44_21445, partial [Phaeodactylibacter sp.]|nr:hypothetical protein [Phaeodactylibacter sp.]
WCFYDDSNHRLWLGTQSGLFFLDQESNQVRRFPDAPSFKSMVNVSVYSIQEDRSGQIWICTNFGLYQMDLEKGLVGHYSAANQPPWQLPLRGLYHLYEDPDGIFWLATNGSGMVRWDRQQQQAVSFKKDSGLPDNVIYAVYEDAYGALWLSSDYGIIQFDKATYNSNTYLPKDGVSHYEFNKVSHYQDSDGTIYFGSLNGVTSFHPRDFQQQRTTVDAPLVITEYSQLNGRTNQLVDRTSDVLHSNKIRIYPKDRFSVLRFALLTYEEMNNVRYAYRLEGIDEEWNEQAANFLRLSNLPYGRHTLKIKGKSSENRWSRQELVLQVEVVRPVYLRLWFILLALLSFLGGTLYIYRFNMTRRLAKQEADRLRELNDLKTKLYTNISHEFRTPLTVILGMTHSLQEHSHSWTLEAAPRQYLLENLERVYQNGEQLLSLVNQLMDLSRLDARLLQL